MASTLSIEQLADLVALTINDYKRDTWTELTSDLQQYYAMPMMLARSNVEFATSHTFAWKVRTGTSGNARNVGAFSVDNINVDDVFVEASINLRHTESGYAYDKSEFLANQGNEERIVSLINARRSEAWQDLADRMETDWWSKPSTSSDTTTPHGVTYWVVTPSSYSGLDSAATGDGGFDGGNPSGFTSGAGGISSTTYTRWANYCHQYVDVTQEDLVTKMRKGAYKTNFKPPMKIPASAFGGERMGFYAPYSVVATMERLLTFQNDNLGNDLASKDGKTMFRGSSVSPVPQLDSDATDPIYQLNWGKFKPVFLKGDYINETRPRPKAGSHRVIESFLDATWTTACYDRRAQAVYTL